MTSNYRWTRCPVCGRVVYVLRDGTFSAHNVLKSARGAACDMSHRKPPGPESAARLREALRKAFWEYFGLDSNEWGPDRDDESAADTAVRAVRSVDFLSLDGMIYLVQEYHEMSEDAGTRQWTLTTSDEGDLDDLG
jgi:hypothetical protein